MNKEITLLKERLSTRKASILLGAGFSYGAQNAGKNDLLLGCHLADNLYEHFYCKFPPDGKNEEYIDAVSDSKNDLKGLCSILRTEGRVEHRNTYLSNLFLGCKSTGNQYHHKIKNYRWNTIFTLNIDDLVENIFDSTNTPLCVWNNSTSGDRIPGIQTLIKLHGDARYPDDGFVFDREEYCSFTTDENCLLKEFAHIFTSSDMVILGSEFQEDDIAFILGLYKKAGYSDSGHHYFFVSPKLKDLSLRNTIENTDNFHWVEMNTEEFLSFLSTEVVKEEDSRDLLKEQGAYFLDEFVKKDNYVSQIYSGYPISYNDLWYDWDVRYPPQIQLIKSVLNSTESVSIVTLYGIPYCGKTTIAKRCITDLQSKGYLALELTKYNYCALTMLSNYLTTLPSETKVAVLMEDASYHYDQIINFANKNSHTISHLVIITTDSTENHKTRNHHFLKLPDSIEWKWLEVKETIDAQFSGSVFYSLCVKNRLNKYLEYCLPNTHNSDNRNIDRVCTKIRETNDIIDALYFSTEGRYFRDYYAQWLRDKDTEFYFDYLRIISALCKLGISSIPLTTIGKLAPNKAARFVAADFLKAYPDLIYEKNGQVRLFRSRIIGDILQAGDKELIKNALFELVLFSLGTFEEGDGSLAYEIFQKALRVKRIRNNTLLTYDQLIDLFVSLEKHCSNISYFWVQYGLAAQLTKDFEAANNHFLYAKRIQKNSYQVAHALAKNKMEMGLYDLTKGRANSDEHFQNGCSEMEKIINDPCFDRAYNYSVHSYATMLMKYYHQKSYIIPADQCAKLNSYFNVLIQGRIDNNVKDVIMKFIRYCRDNNIPEYISGLENAKDIIPYMIANEDYDID